MCCAIPVPKEVTFADSFVYERIQGAAGFPSKLQPTKTSDGRCENVPASRNRLRDSECSLCVLSEECVLDPLDDCS